MKNFKRMVFFLLFIILPGCQGTQKADLIFRNGKIFTARDAGHFVGALAISDGKIIAAGTNQEVESFRKHSTRFVDLKGKLVIPGFHDAHLHFWNGARLQRQVNLIGSKNKREALQRIKLMVRKNKAGSWIVGRGWDHEIWPDRKLPDHRDLDKIAPDHLVYLKRVDGHAAWVNRKVLDLLNYHSETVDPSGGKILRFPHSKEPSGILIDKAYEILDDLIPEPSLIEKLEILQSAVAYANTLGITSITDNTDASLFPAYAQLLSENRLTLRVNFWVSGWTHPDTLQILRDKQLVDYRFLNCGLLKYYVDGSMGSRSAYLLAPYQDDPGNSGLLQEEFDKLLKSIESADKEGWQVGIHAIGDAGNRMALDIFQSINKQRPKLDHRWRIEHAQFVQPDDLLRFASLGVIASMQPSHCISDMKWVAQRIGERAKYTYSWRSMLDNQIPLAFGTDWPVEQLNPLLGIYAAITRQDTLGNPDGGWFPEQRLTVGEAVCAYTAGSAYAVKSEKWLGKLLPGYVADLVILDRDIFEILPSEILKTRVEATYLNGKQVYPKP
jgi:predicted amidohydrolase YtcJ